MTTRFLEAEPNMSAEGARPFAGTVRMAPCMDRQISTHCSPSLCCHVVVARHLWDRGLATRTHGGGLGAVSAPRIASGSGWLAALAPLLRAAAVGRDLWRPKKRNQYWHVVLDITTWSKWSQEDEARLVLRDWCWISLLGASGPKRFNKMKQSALFVYAV